MLAFVVTHLAAHGTLLISLPYAQDALVALMQPWRSAPGTALLVTAFLLHYANAFWSVYERRSLRLTRWQWAQLGFGMAIPLLLVQHVATTRLAEAFLGTDNSYNSVFVLLWLLAPWLAIVQAVALLTVWIHACIGIHFWLRTKLWYADWRIGFGAFALLLPTLALSGFLSAGNQVMREAGREPAFAKNVLGDAGLTDDAMDGAKRMTGLLVATHLGLIVLVLAGRGVRRRIHEARRPPVLAHPSGQRLPILPGATVLETLRDHGVPHASVCGGRARCTTMASRMPRCAAAVRVAPRAGSR